MAVYTENDLEILIATMDREDLSFLKAIFGRSVDQIKTAITIVNQSDTASLSSSYPNINVINDTSFGISRSRNMAINKSSRELLWILDDDCEVLPDAIEHIITAHNSYKGSIIAFQTLRKEDGRLFGNYPAFAKALNRKELKNVLSPEITLKRTAIMKNEVSFDQRFGLGAKYQDSENYVFLIDAMEAGMETQFYPAAISKHKSTTSSDEADSDRLIYARGALAAREGRSRATLLNFKYSFFLLRKGYVKSIAVLKKKHNIFRKGVEDYLKETGREMKK
jgi:glycosyltransferase involved in cell wall biosynthesis